MKSDIKIYETLSPEETLEVGKELGKASVAGQVYALVGDLGVGKTVFTKGFAEGLGIEEAVNSPTFTILQIYTEGRLALYHFDVYRLSGADELYATGADEYFHGQGVCMIEWPEKIEELLPENCIRIRIDKDLSKGFDYRRITICDEGEQDEDSGF